MATQNLMDRAREIARRRLAGGVAGAAMVIVPLAMAAPAAADSVVFRAGGTFVTEGATGGFFGHATTTENVLTGGVTLKGDTQAVYTTPPPNPTYLTAGFAHDNLGLIQFRWDGTFDPGTLNTTDVLNIIYSLSFTGIPNPPGHTVADVSWLLDIQIRDGASAVMASYSTLGTGMNTTFADGLSQPIVVSGTPATWEVGLDLQWKYETTGSPKVPVYPNDELNMGATIELSVPRVAGPVAAPLPGIVWLGGTMLLGMWGVAGMKKYARRRAGNDGVHQPSRPARETA